MENDFFSRLDKYMVASGLNDNQLTVIASLSIGALGKQRKGSRGLGSDSIAKILCACPDLSGDWLLTGRGQMLKNADSGDMIMISREELERKNRLIDTIPGLHETIAGLRRLLERGDANSTAGFGVVPPAEDAECADAV